MWTPFPPQHEDAFGPDMGRGSRFSLEDLDKSQSTIRENKIATTNRSTYKQMRLMDGGFLAGFHQISSSFLLLDLILLGEFSGQGRRCDLRAYGLYATIKLTYAHLKTSPLWEYKTGKLPWWRLQTRSLRISSRQWLALFTRHAVAFSSHLAPLLQLVQSALQTYSQHQQNYLSNDFRPTSVNNYLNIS